MIRQLVSTRALRSWLDATQHQEINCGLDHRLLLARAGRLRKDLATLSVDGVADRLRTDPELPGTLQALVYLLRRQAPGSDSYAEVAKAYQLVVRLTWADEFGERDGILAELAFLAWNCSRRYRTYQETQDWEIRLTDHVVAQEPAQHFLSVSFLGTSEPLRLRFLREAPILVTIWQQLDRSANQKPAAVMTNGLALFDWFVRNRPLIDADDETLRYLEGRLALTLVIVLAHLGRGREWGVWFDRARTALRTTQGARPYLAMVEYARLARLHITRQFETVDRDIGVLVERFVELAMPEAEMKARFLRATNLKELNRDREALEGLDSVRRQAVLRGHAVIASLAAASIAQLYGRAGAAKLADCYVGVAHRAAHRSGCEWVEAYSQGTLGELLRDRGLFLHAVAAYRASGRCYERSEMYTLAAYTRVLTAETLLLAGCEEQAVAELIPALPAIEQENLSAEAQVSAELLREVVQRRGAVNYSLLRVPGDHARNGEDEKS